MPASFRPEGVIFDLDGTLVDNMTWHAAAFQAFTERHGLPPFTIEWRRRTDGKRNREIFPMLFGREMAIEEIRELEREKESMYRELSRGGIAPMTGLERLLGRLEAHRIPVAIATSAPPENVDHALAETGLATRLVVIARGDQVARGKPAPDVFLLAASRLGVDPARCLAFEDAPLGVAAAKTAGMRCVAITSSFTAEAFAEADIRPDAAYPDFDHFVEAEGKWLETVG